MYNKVTLIGNLGNDPELISTPSGATLTRFSLATNERFKNRAGEVQSRTEWHRVIVWGKQAESCKEFLHKGSLVMVEGSISSRQFEVEGQKRRSYEIRATRVQFLSRNTDSKTAPSTEIPNDMGTEVDGVEQF